MVVAISYRANRRLAGATVELDRKQCAQLRQIFRKVDAIAHKHNTNCFLQKPPRERSSCDTSLAPALRTLDVDSAIAVRDWLPFQYLTTAFIVDVR
jgi:hypothetical protein